MVVRALQTPRSMKKEWVEVLQIPEQILRSLWKRPWWSRLLPCRPGRTHQSRYTRCSLCRNPHRSSFSDRTEPRGKPMKTSLFLKDEIPWKAHTLEQFLKNLPGGKDIYCNSSWGSHGKDPSRSRKKVWREGGSKDSVTSWPASFSTSLHCS